MTKSEAQADKEEAEPYPLQRKPGLRKARKKRTRQTR